MNPFATPFIPLASPQPSFATQNIRKTRSKLQHNKCEEEAVPSARDQVMSSSMTEAVFQLSDGSFNVQHSASLTTQTRCEVPQSHAATNLVCDQALRPTTLSSSESISQNPSSFHKTDSPKGVDYGPESKWKEANRNSATGDTIIEVSEPDAVGHLVPKLPEAKVPQLHRVPSKKTSDTDNGGVPDKVRSQKACKK
ncbi:hypothetical protein TARUN_9071 [Trichoderma arundinaceum]|uniref:Uncharacterized protein n=1 Tax=Trichoderma arundinaceum TaxID=490622 RepID=A0A395NB58_TRIAR|nr:hypothetical protein TARUN_9071 [Trichoderma arundinaceum]